VTTCAGVDTGNATAAYYAFLFLSPLVAGISVTKKKRRRILTIAENDNRRRFGETISPYCFIVLR
jgi:hypothetical protein